MLTRVFYTSRRGIDESASTCKSADLVVIGWCVSSQESRDFSHGSMSIISRQNGMNLFQFLHCVIADGKSVDEHYFLDVVQLVLDEIQQQSLEIPLFVQLIHITWFCFVIVFSSFPLSPHGTSSHTAVCPLRPLP